MPPWTHRLYCPQAREDAEAVELLPDQVHYIGRVLRLDSGAAIRLFDGRGAEFLAVIDGRGRRKPRVAGLQRVEALPESPLPLTVYQCIARGDRMDWAFQKATELGARRLFPVISERTEVRLSGDRLVRRMAHWQAVVGSACEQCGRAWVPEVFEPVPLHALSDPGEEGETRLLGSLEASALPLPALAKPKALAILIGPEGGLTFQEERLLTGAGWQAISLGPRVLRTETAGVAALAVCQALWGDLAGP